ncbi:MAG: hypothetical protein ACRC1K_00855, partial [Planctomycetia bacterium]
MDVLLLFRHGLGDAVQLTALVRRLKAARPGWRVTAAVLRGKHTALGAAADRVVVLDDESPDPAAYEAVFPLRW